MNANDEHGIEPIGGGETVLVIDDEEMIRTICKDILEEFGYQVLQAENGEAGLRLFAENRQKIQLVILDMVMPRLSGQETLRRLLAIDPQVKVLFSTGFGEGQKLNESLALGAKGIILKPYQIEHLLKKVRETLDSRI